MPCTLISGLQLLFFKTFPVGYLLIVYERKESDHAISRHLYFVFLKPTRNLPHGLTLISARALSKEVPYFFEGCLQELIQCFPITGAKGSGKICAYWVG